MSHIAPALAVLQAGDAEKAKAMLVQAFDQAPGPAAALLAKIALDEGLDERAETLSRTAIDNGTALAVISLADAVGRQGRRDEAEQIALRAVPRHSDSGLLRAVLGEQRIRQAKWDLGTQDFIDAMSLDERDATVRHLERVMRDLTVGHRAGKIPTQRAATFIDRVQNGAPGNHGDLSRLFASARRALSNKSILPALPKGNAPSHGAPPPPPKPARVEHKHLNPPPLPNQGGNLITMMRRDRALNAELQAGLAELGRPKWPSDHNDPIDTLPRMVPRQLEIDQEEFRREHLNLTSGSVDSEIIIERALQSLLSAVASTTADTPGFNSVGLTQLELALWDGVLEKMRTVAPVYLGAVKEIDAPTLAIGSFLGRCIVRPGDATWSFEKEPGESTIETVHGDLRPFDLARKWVAAANKDDVHLEEFLGEAKREAQLESVTAVFADTTAGLEGRALSMKLAELWINWRCHPLDTAQTVVADAIRPLNSLESVVFMALSTEYAPPMATGHKRGSKFRGEVAIAYVRGTGEFLGLGSRKHFARAIGVLCGQITTENQAMIVDMFGSFHRPSARVIRDGPEKPRIEKKRDATMLRFAANVGDETQAFALLHAPEAAVTWRLLQL